uniref:Transposase n=1 Tax=Haemonchus placei TaxID=6290 RepID=A0A0N4X4V1_HAEPC
MTSMRSIAHNLLGIGHERLACQFYAPPTNQRLSFPQSQSHHQHETTTRPIDQLRNRIARWLCSDCLHRKFSNSQERHNHQETIQRWLDRHVAIHLPTNQCCSFHGQRQCHQFVGSIDLLLLLQNRRQRELDKVLVSRLLPVFHIFAHSWQERFLHGHYIALSTNRRFAQEP